MRIEDLKRIKQKVQNEIKLREGEHRIRVIVSMGTCGISVGARDVMAALLDELSKENIEGVAITQTGCLGMCEKEPNVVVEEEGKPKIIYGYVSPEIARRIVREHIKNGKVLEEYVVMEE